MKHIKKRGINSQNNLFKNRIVFKKIFKKAQVTIFIILAILIIGGISTYFIVRDNNSSQKIPEEFNQIYSYYLSYIEEETSNALMIMGQQGGYLKSVEFSSGNSYMPFSSHLDFLGSGIPYWYYVSGNGISKEQIPSKERMQQELNEFLQERLFSIDFSEFEEEGYFIELNEPKVNSIIKEDFVLINVDQNLNFNFNDSTWNKRKHSEKVDSLFGKFYDFAKKIYLDQKQTMFLENYALDILRLYAPVDGSEISCSPKIWPISGIKENLTVALENNIPQIKIKGDYYSLKDKEKEYFVQDIGEESNININFVYIRDWPMKLEIWPSEDIFLKAEPIGLQQGLGILGFCYVPYHFVYDFAYPVLIQLNSHKEIFQFPIVVSINKNKPREALNVEGLPDVIPELCEHNLADISVYTYNNNFEPIKSSIKFKCFSNICNIGETQLKNNEAILEGKFPQCVNGFILANAEGYEEGKYQISSLDEEEVIIFLDKKYNLNLEVQKDNKKLMNDIAIILFTKENNTKTILYPSQSQIELSSGEYEIKTYIYSNSSINLNSGSTQKCIKVSKSGVAGFLGFTEEKCFDIDFPEQIISQVISGGGTQKYYIGESELIDSSKLIVNADDFNIPKTIEQLQSNYNNIEISKLNIIFI